MAKSKIIAIGLELNSDDVCESGFNSDISLLDWDIVIFKPDISDFISHERLYQGKPRLDEAQSFRLKEKSEHWRREIKDAVDSGKTVFVYLTDLEDFYIDTGERKFSGTGKNRQTTVLVNGYNNYECIPAKIGPVKTKGSEMRLSPKKGDVLASYWKEFSGVSSYKVVLTAENVPACLLTKNGEKPVGAIYRPKDSNGSLVLLPDIEFFDDRLVDEEGEWTEESARFARKLIGTMVSADKVLRGNDEFTPEPEWAGGSIYRLKKEKALSESLLKVEAELEKVQLEKEKIIREIKDASRLRNLLYEKGRPLEHAIIEALEKLGFKACQFNDGTSEFDAVFESKEGRLIGEAEGKDGKAINIDKFRQLAMNIHEDFEREEVEAPAKAVLFGNPYRLQPLEARGQPFTNKCITASATNSTALVFTPDLFRVVKYLSDSKDARFAEKCRKALLSTAGQVVFPELPASRARAQEVEKNTS